MSRHWPKVRLGEVLRRSEEMAVLQADTEYSEITVRLWGKGVIERGRVLGAEIAGNKRFVAREGQFIASRIDARSGAMGIVPAHLDGAVVTNDFPLFNIDAGHLLPAYFRWLSGTQGFVELCLLASEGTTNRVRLKEDRFLALEIPLPPLAEQRRIVARIEELATQIHEARSLRSKVADEAGALMASSRNHFATRLKLLHPETTLGDICKRITDGPHVSPRYVEIGVPFISVRNICETGLDFTTAKFVSEHDHAEFSRKAKVECGDLLYTKGGTTGVARRVDTTRQFSIWVHVALLKLKRDMAEAGFVEHMLNAPPCKEQAEAFTRGSSNRDLGLSRMAMITLPLPSLPEQRRIVAELDALQAEVDALKRHQRETAAELDALLPAILDRAFHGEL